MSISENVCVVNLKNRMFCKYSFHYRNWHGFLCYSTAAWWPFSCSNDRLLLPSGGWSVYDG